MAKLKLNLRKLAVPEKIARARQIITALTGNASFATPHPTLGTVTTRRCYRFQLFPTSGNRPTRSASGNVQG